MGGSPPAKRPKAALLPEGYETFLVDLKERIRTAQHRAAVAANRELIGLDWQLGRDIVERQKVQGWDKVVVERLARDLQTAFPGMTGFSPRNVWRMRSFCLAYTEDARKLPRPVFRGAYGEEGLTYKRNPRIPRCRSAGASVFGAGGFQRPIMVIMLYCVRLN